jgi:putative ABC transport system permease protein
MRGALLRANLRRSAARTVLTAGTFAVALFLFGILAAVRSGFRQGIDAAGADRLVVIGRTSIIQPLPIAYRDRIARIPGVRGVAQASWFGGVYQDEMNFFPQFAVDPETFRPMFPEFIVDDEEWRDFLQDRQGCVVGAKTARRFGWKVGDRVPLRGTVFRGEWVFNVRAIYRGRRSLDDETQFWLRADYLRENGPEWWRDLVGWYWVHLTNVEGAVAVAKSIDEAFANSPWETRTQSESAFAASWIQQMGNVEFLILAIGAVVFFTLLFMTGNTMAMAVRERTSEIAILKAIGYSDGRIAALVLAEGLLVAGAGAAVGLGLAYWLVTERDLARGLLVLYLPGGALAAGASLALVVACLAGTLPALSAARLRVADGLRRV